MNSVHCDPSHHSSEMNLSCHYALSSHANSSHLGLTTKSLQLVLISSTHITSSTNFIPLEVITFSKSADKISRSNDRISSLISRGGYSLFIFAICCLRPISASDLLCVCLFFFFSFYRQVLGYSVFAIAANFHSPSISLVTNNALLCII